MPTVIEDVILHLLTRHADERGYFEELIRVNDPFFQEGFGQLSHTKMHPGCVKAWHIHQRQIDWWYVFDGHLLVALYDTREDSPTRGVTQEIHLGEDLPPAILKIPPRVAHGCRVIGPEPVHLFYVTSRIYDPADEGRIPHNDPEINYDWLRLPSIK